MLKDCLQKNNISVTHLSKVIGVSRPTLYKFMEIFDSGGTLPDERYQIIFKTICETADDRNALLRKLNRFDNLIKREKTIGAYDLPIEKANLLNKFIAFANEDLHSKDCDKSIYQFINMIVSSYKKERAFLHYARYILILNGVLGKDQITDDDKAFFSNIFRINSQYKNNSLEFDEISYSNFLRRIDQIKDEHSHHLKGIQMNVEKELKEALKNKITEEITKRIDSGLNIDNIDYNEIVDNISIQQNN